MNKNLLAFSQYINSIDLPTISCVYVKVNKVVVTILFVVKSTRKKIFIFSESDSHTHTHIDTTFIDMEYPNI